MKPFILLWRSVLAATSSSTKACCILSARSYLASPHHSLALTLIIIHLRSHSFMTHLILDHTPSTEMEVAFPSAQLETVSYCCTIISIALVLYASAVWFKRPSIQLKPNYAFSASTRIRHRGPTVLPFAARVPPGDGTVPTALRTFTMSHSNVLPMKRA